MNQYGKKNLRTIFKSKYILLLVSLVVCMTAHAVVTSRYAFNSQEQNKRFEQLTENLRCVVCQNQNLAESNADIANDMKQSIYEAILADKTDTSIVSDLQKRYGDFILFSPPLNKNTFLLWFGPFILLLLGFAYIRRVK